MGLHERYARWLGDMPQKLLCGRKEDEIRRQMSVLFEGMMKTVYKTEGAQLAIDILSTPQVREFIEGHAGTLDSSFENVKMSDAMRRRLSRSNFIFSGLKTFHEANEAIPLLFDENGVRKPFEQFLNDARNIDEVYNRNWLRAEYNFVAASAEMAAKWERFMEDGDRYHLQYRTQKDDKVRPEHAALDGVTLPPSDPFWEEFYPPNGWNCRCTVVQVRKSKYPATSHEEAMRLGDEALQRDTKGTFRFNPGKEQKTVPDYNPYSIRRCRDCDIAKGKRKLARPSVDESELCQACAFIRAMRADEATRRLTKEERKDISSAALSWASEHLPKVTLSDGSPAFRLSKTLENGDELHIGKKFISETFAKSKNSRRLAETMQMATEVEDWIGTARYVRTEAGRHHDFDFRVYEAEVDGQKIELKAKVTDGLILYLMKLI
ncbi:phage minor head protein [uncultured Muribaculum sp.]|uniref:phage head morphogenesis protein n=1 Tax=uncultured Muribaculum sp. TaxID=1918613 RepID=UPI00260BAC51|nr:phage minor head protein [uncultured Muribaculum sp.]